MKLIRNSLSVLAIAAILLSAVPAFGGPTPFEQTDDDGSGSGSGGWTVTCDYDGNERLIAKRCVSGGTQSCNCP